VIREYQAADCVDVLNVWARASAVAHPFLPSEFLDRERQRIPTAYLPLAKTWVWEAERHVVGFLSLIGHEVGALFVDPASHRSGIGRALIDRACDLRGDIEVKVFAKNQLARSFYAKVGFVLVDQAVHGETGFDLMRLRLAANNRLTFAAIGL
jgi:putative acetyltransferase